MEEADIIIENNSNDNLQNLEEHIPAINSNTLSDSLQDASLVDPILDTPVEVETEIESKIEPILDTPVEVEVETETEIESKIEPILDTPVEVEVETEIESKIEPILDTPVEVEVETEIKDEQEPIQEIINKYSAMKEIDTFLETNSQTSSNKETLGDSVPESISNSVTSNSVNDVNLNNLENNITNIIELYVVERQDLMNDTNITKKVITETNLNNIDNPIIQVKEEEIIKKQDEIKIIPEPEIIELDKILQSYNLPIGKEGLTDNNFLLKPNVTFSSDDLHNIIGIGNNSQIGNLSSLNTNSDFSYTKRIKDTKQPDLIPKVSNKNIRISNPLGNSSKK